MEALPDDDHPAPAKFLDHAEAVIEQHQHYRRADDIDANRAIDQRVLAIFRADDRTTSVELVIDLAAVRYSRRDDYVTCLDGRTGEQRLHFLALPPSDGH
jgi:hypothetical protein